MMAEKLRIAVAASGSGTCFQSVLDNIQKGDLEAEVVQLITDNPYCKAAERAQKYCIPVLAVEAPPLAMLLTKDEGFSGRDRNLAARVIQEDRIVRGFEGMPGLIDTHPQHLVMLGYMRVLTDYFVGRCSAYDIGIWNTHPAPIPEYRGEKGYAWGVGEDRESVRRNGWHCVSFHKVTDSDFDTGPVMSMSPLEIGAGETEASLKERGMRREYEQIRQCLQWLAEGKVAGNDRRISVLNGMGIGYDTILGLEEFIDMAPSGRCVLDVTTSARGGAREGSYFEDVDVRVDVKHAEAGSDSFRAVSSAKAGNAPYNLAFTYAYREVQERRREGYDVQLIFDGLDIHPVVMKKDMVE